jgi:tetratricopeptide (TPR) repeat protein
LISAVLIGAAAPAHADAKADKQLAKQYVDAGLAAQDTGNYDTAITLYQKAYDLVPHPVLIFNIAQATRLAGHLADALALYEKYLAQDPHGAKADVARDFIDDLKAKLAAEREHAAAAAPVAAPPPPVDAPPADAPGRTLRLTGLTVGAAGIIGAGLGLGFAVHGRTLTRDVEKTYDPAKVHAGDRANTIAYLGGIGGGLLIATGAALYYWGHSQASHDEHLAVAPAVAPGMAGLVISGAWR